jgi:hypothetical protein
MASVHFFAACEMESKAKSAQTVILMSHKQDVAVVMMTGIKMIAFVLIWGQRHLCLGCPVFSVWQLRFIYVGNRLQILQILNY